MPQVDIDGANSKVSADTIRGQSGTTVTIQSGHNLVGSGSGLTALPAANLTGTLPAISGTNLTNLPAANLTGTLPAISGASLTNLPGGGAWNLLQSTTISSSTAAVAFSSTYITSTYKRFRVDILDAIPVTDNVRFDMVLSTNNGSSYITSGYEVGGQVIYFNSSSAAVGTFTGGTKAYMVAGGNNTGNATGERNNYIIYLDDLTTSQYHIMFGYGMYGSQDDYGQHAQFGNRYKTAVAVNNIKFNFSSGNIASGIFKLYGLNS